MIEFKIANVKDLFFDREKVKRAKDAGFRLKLSRMGAFIRTRAISSILRHKIKRGFGVKSKVRNKHAGQVSPVGEPPYSHEGSLVKFLFFAWDDSAKAVFIGPVKLNRPSIEVPATLEYGGPMVRVEKRLTMASRVRRMFYRPRPYMHPALIDELPKLPNELTGCVRAE